jgi:uncharacterized surface protein with fasciclin (FAS1) repeats
MANIFETVQAERDCKTYVKGVESFAGLGELLSGPGPYTLFVPTDAGFESLPSGKRTNLLADPEKLSKVLRYHIVPGYYTAMDLLAHLFLKTLEGSRLRVWSDIAAVPLGEREIDTYYKDALNYVASNTVTTAVRESITINGAHVLRADVKAVNGIMHVIDKVLVPPFTML